MVTELLNCPKSTRFAHTHYIFQFLKILNSSNHIYKKIIIVYIY